jgi:hypothetical protein
VVASLLGLMSNAALAASDDADALAGPKVGDGAAQSVPLEGRSTTMDEAPKTRPSIVHRGFHGEVTLIEDQRIEVAAVRAMPLDDAVRARVDAVLAERASQVSHAMLEHYELFLQLQSALQFGQPTGTTQERRAQRERLRSLSKQMQEAISPLLNPPLIDRLAKELPEADATQLREIVAEYHEAAAPAMQERREQAGRSSALNARAKQPARANAARKEVASQHLTELRATVREMARSLASLVQERRERLESLLGTIEATPEQRSKIDAIVRRDGNALQPTQEQRDSALRDILALLTLEQRRALLTALREPQAE